MISVPPNLTAFQGFDAFFHSAEGYIASIANPVSDAYSLASIELIAKSLPTAIKDGKNIEARTDVALANTIAGFTQSTSSCTSEHSMEHAMSAYHPKLPPWCGTDYAFRILFQFFRKGCPGKICKDGCGYGHGS